ncbi:hypothetical protein ABZ297_26575 [Nonomuraea sp. NPDC005983]|uniref:hypothetical protein n=1 Tax=Nonomuraea sp. NPDC005983 TaxID=3155595 RepID=UPI0033AAC9DA
MSSPQNPQYGDDPASGQPQWSQPPPPPPPYQPPYPQPQRQGAPVLSIIGFVCAAVSLLFIPILFGIAGIVLGIVGHVRGESLGKWAAVTSGITMVLGMIIGYLVVRSMTA